MRSIFYNSLLVLVPLLVTGCDIKELASRFVTDNPVIYIPPTLELQVDENLTAIVHGFDECPDNTFNWFVAPSMKVFTNSCVRLDPSKKQVKVGLRIADKVAVETWEVHHYGDAVKLTRPNGFEVRSLN